MTLYRNKYRVELNRMPKWDYSGNGFYFITMVAAGRKCWFGDVKNNKMVYSDFGLIVIDEWNKSFSIRKELFQDEFQLMPNHLHAIVIINKQTEEAPDHDSLQDNSYASSGFTVEPNDGFGVAMNGRSSQQNNFSAQRENPDLATNQSSFIRKPKSISSFVAGFKSAATNKIDDFIDINNLNIEKFNRKNRLWQTNYYDHVIRNKKEYWKIKNYIRNNPKNWKEDKFSQC
jgi:REP element-mobilizing transposase RayT